jgi:Xaa-Pro aminopeptidase
MTPDRQASLTFQKDLSADELRSRRDSLMKQMAAGFAVVQAATEVPGFDPFRQSNDFYYLTGVEVPHCYLLMDAGKGASVLYLPPRDEIREETDGPCLSVDDADFILTKTAIEEVRPVSRLIEDAKGFSQIWLVRAPAEGCRQCQDTLRHHLKSIESDPLDGRMPRELRLMLRLARCAPSAEFRDLSPLIHRQRLVKSSAEVEVIRKSSQLSALACKESMKATRAGIYEFQLGALADYFFQINGAQGSGYRPIIATGHNIWMMHYWRNNTQLKSGDLVLFDYAPDYNNYTSDIGRMWPVNGKFSAVQRELYGFVLEHHKTLLSVIRAGRTKDEVLDDAAERMRSVAERWNWSKAIYKSGAMKLLESKRPLSHGIGMAVHESATWAEHPIEAGLVFAVDPELVILEEELYIRVEDTIVVTETGIENLTASCPFEIADIEVMIGGDGILQRFPPVIRNPGR